MDYVRDWVQFGANFPVIRTKEVLLTFSVIDLSQPAKTSQSMVPKANLRTMTARLSGAAFLKVYLGICGYICG